MTGEKNFAVVFAYNEEKTVGKVLQDLIKAKNMGLIHKIILIDDGSTDNTPKIAKELKIDSLKAKENVGKGQAFIEATNFCAKNGATNLLMFDADLLEIKPAQIQKLLRPLKNPTVKMTIGTVQQDGTALSGERAIRISALRPLFLAKNKNWIRHMQRFGLEATLNHYLGIKSILLPKIFVKFGGDLYNGTHPFLKKVKIANTKFKSLPANRRGQWVTDQAWKKRCELMAREVKAHELKKSRAKEQKQKMIKRTKFLKR
ncbi:MAG: glycosyltransferase [archaeon]|jgi:glycosyltransferase involved in cell wall biosynthesis